MVIFLLFLCDPRRVPVVFHPIQWSFSDMWPEKKVFLLLRVCDPRWIRAQAGKFDTLRTRLLEVLCWVPKQSRAVNSDQSRRCAISSPTSTIGTRGTPRLQCDNSLGATAKSWISRRNSRSILADPQKEWVRREDDSGETRWWRPCDIGWRYYHQIEISFKFLSVQTQSWPNPTAIPTYPDFYPDSGYLLCDTRLV